MSIENEVNFCFNVLRQEFSSKKSIVFSPAALLNNLALIYSGADGKTAEEIHQVLGKGVYSNQPFRVNAKTITDKSRAEILYYYSGYIAKVKKEKAEAKDVPSELTGQFDCSNDNTNDDGSKGKEPNVAIQKVKQEVPDDYDQDNETSDSEPPIKKQCPATEDTASLIPDISIENKLFIDAKLDLSYEFCEKMFQSLMDLTKLYN